MCIFTKNNNVMTNYLDNSFDEKFNDLHWLPWIGKEYFKAENNIKLLLLGESHYVPEGEEEDPLYDKNTWTREFILKEGINSTDSKKVNPLVKNIEKAIYLKENISNEMKLKLWETVVYFNLIQKLLSSRMKRPDGDDIIMGWKVFINVIDIIKPNICIVLGKSSYGTLGHLKANLMNELDVSFNKSNGNNCAHIKRNDFETKLLFIRHPSAYFSWERWGRIINNEFPDLKNKYSSK